MTMVPLLDLYSLLMLNRRIESQFSVEYAVLVLLFCSADFDCIYFLLKLCILTDVSNLFLSFTVVFLFI